MADALHEFDRLYGQGCEYQTLNNLLGESIMKKLKTLTTAAGLAVALALPAAGALADLTANGSATSNYVWRGLTQTDNGPAIQGGIDWSADFGLYVGTWTSNSSFGSYELDLYAGWSQEFGPVSIDVGALYYAYPQFDDSGPADPISWPEAYGSVSFKAGPVDMSAMLAYTNGIFGTKSDALYGEFGASWGITKDLSLSGTVGAYDFENDKMTDVDFAGYEDYIWGGVSLGYKDFAFTVSKTNLDQDKLPATNFNDWDTKVFVSWSHEWDLLK